NANLAGTCCQIESIFGAVIDQCAFSGPGPVPGSNGLVIGAISRTNTGVSITNCEATNLGNGFIVRARGKLSNITATLCGVGLDLSGSLSVNYARLEVNGTGLQTARLTNFNGLISN